MPNFLARVVLHNTDSRNDFSDFHNAMRKRGFLQTINGRDGDGQPSGVYALPAGTYYFDAKLTTYGLHYATVGLAHDAVEAAVAEVMKDETQAVRVANTPPCAVVIQDASMAWRGLKRVK